MRKYLDLRFFCSEFCIVKEVKVMAIDYASLKKGGFMRQKQKGYFSLRLQVVGGTLTAENLRIIQEVADKYGHGYVHLTSSRAWRYRL